MKKYFLLKGIFFLLIIIGLFLEGISDIEFFSLKTKAAVSNFRERREEKVVKLIDSKTIETQDGKKIRLIGLDCEENQKKLKFLLGKEIEVELDFQELDLDGAILGYVFWEGLFINADFIRRGYCKVLISFPNIRYRDLFLQLEQEAKERKIGIWKQ